MRRWFMLVAVCTFWVLNSTAQNVYMKFIEAAKRGDAAAQNEIGVCYDKGLGVTQDLNQAFQWYSKAAAQNLPLAQYNLGSIPCALHI